VDWEFPAITSDIYPLLKILDPPLQSHIKQTIGHNIMLTQYRYTIFGNIILPLCMLFACGICVVA